MPVLHVQNIPEDLLMQIQLLAEAHHRALDTEIIILLNQALRLEKVKDRKIQLKALASIHQRRFVPPENSASSLALLREERDH